MDELTRLALTARDGDRMALAAFVRRSQSEIWRYVAGVVGPAEADDVTQDVYVRAWRSIGRFRGDASARTWLFVIARRACADALRGRARRQRLSHRLEAESEMTAATDTDRAAGQALESLVDLLPVDRREAFVLTQLVGCSYDETAAICGVPVGTIRSRVARARGDLVDMLREADAVGNG
jgi:RNA polymerase sigma-70 factor (ECF subfamily)